MPDGREYILRYYDNIHSCAGSAAMEKLAQDWVYMKTKKHLGYVFECRASQARQD
jgi:hypothetical protein